MVLLYLVFNWKGLRNINKIQRIEIENVKGKDFYALDFNELHANFPNLFIAPNGFGKSTFATTFKALKANKIELDSEDLFEGKIENVPSLKIEIVLTDNGSLSLVANSTKNEINKLIDTHVINNPVYAKSTSRSIGRFSTKSAKLDVQNLEFYDKIPSKIDIPKAKEIKDEFGNRGKVFGDFSFIFNNLINLSVICDNYSLLNKCVTQKGPQIAINKFFDQLTNSGSGKEIKKSITSDCLELLKGNSLILKLIQIVESLENHPYEKENEIELALTAIQIIEITKRLGSNFKKAKAYFEYVEYRKELDYKLSLFNTTGRSLKTKETKNKLVVEFLAANKMSNGERDVLSFISNLSKFKVKFTKNIGILIIDEIFDYLDGSNMLIVQYYLSQMIEECKKMNKILFPIILTHLDPSVFNNYYFKKPKIHYLKNFTYSSDNNMLDLLKLRGNKSTYKELSEKIEAHYLHFNPDVIQLTATEKSKLNNPQYQKTELFYEMIDSELEKYLNDEKYDPLKIICAIRVKIEKIVFEQLANSEQKEKYIKTHTTINKLIFAVEKGIDVPEDFFLLQPLYNDALHLNENDSPKSNKIKSICLKLDNIVVQEIVRKVQQMESSKLVGV